MARRKHSLHRLGILVIVALVGMFGRPDKKAPSRYPAWTDVIRERLEFPLHDRVAYAVIELEVPAGSERFGVEDAGRFWWTHDLHPGIHLAMNPNDNRHYDANRPCRYPELRVPLMDGMQLACLDSSGYLVVREVVLGTDTLRCAVRSYRGDFSRLGDAWALCANMNVRVERPSLEITTHQKIAFAGCCDVRIGLPHRFVERAGWSSHERTFVRGRDESLIWIRLNEHVHRKDPSMERICGDSSVAVWQREQQAATLVYCRHHIGPEYPDYFSVLRLVRLGQDVVSCQIEVGDQRDLPAMINVCESLYVIHKQ